MKHIFTFIVCLVLATAARADIKLHFHVTAPTAKEVVVVYNTTVLPVQLDDKGNGSLTVAGVRAVHARLYYGQVAKAFFMEDGDDLTFTFTGNDFAGTAALSGPKARLFRYLNTVQYDAPKNEDFKLPFADYRKLLADKEKAAQQTLATWKLGREFPRFTRIEAGRITYGFAQNLMMYAVGHPYMAKLQGWKPDAAYTEAIREYAVERPELAELRAYTNYMTEAARILDAGSSDTLSLYDRTLRKMQWLADNLKNDTLRQTLINDVAIEYVGMKGTEGISALRNLQGAYVTLPALTKAFDAVCAERDAIAPGHVSPDVKGEALDGKTVSLSSLRGKYVFIDVWATWCGPCRMEFPHLRKLEDSLKTNNITFLGLSIDKDKEAWRKVAPTLGGTQLHIGPTSDFLKAYHIDGIPRFILIDPKGRIVNNDMSRPSDANTLGVIRALPGI